MCQTIWSCLWRNNESCIFEATRNRTSMTRTSIVDLPSTSLLQIQQQLCYYFSITKNWKIIYLRVYSEGYRVFRISSSRRCFLSISSYSDWSSHHRTANCFQRPVIYDPCYIWMYSVESWTTRNCCWSSQKWESCYSLLTLWNWVDATRSMQNSWRSRTMCYTMG